MKKGSNQTPRANAGDRSPRASFSEKGPQPVPSKLNIITKNFISSSVEEDIANLPHKENEIKLLAKQIGIDYETEKSKYQWFLVQIVSLDLPVGWMKEEDPNGIIYYHNPSENVTSQKHPMIAKFRLLFNEILENEMVGKSKMIALKEKVQKLEMEKEKEKEAQSPKKPNPTKGDRNKKKQPTVIPASSAGFKISKGELTDRSSKGNADQPQGLIDSDKSKERFDKVKEVLEQRRNVQAVHTNEVDNLTKTEDVLNMCKQHYAEKFGIHHIAPPDSIVNLETYNLVDPNEVVEAARLFNVRSTQAYLFWVIRAYCGLPLPEYWTKSFDTNLLREIYFNSVFDVKISVKPCYFYILELVNYIKQEATADKDSFLHFSNKITLCDKLGRYYDVDLATMIKDLIEKPNGERKNYYTYHQKKENTKDEGQKVTRKRKKDEVNPNYSDAHFLEIANQLGVDLNTEIHLLMVIEDFVKTREPVERWFFRQVPEGPVFWVNHEQQKAVNKYPYLKEIKSIIDDARASAKEHMEVVKKHTKSEFSLIKTLFRKQPEDAAWKMLLDEAKNYVEFFIKLREESSPSRDNRTYNLSNLVRKVGAQLSKHDLMDILFYCPFDFTQFISEEFLKSSESYLLKKIKLKSAGGHGNGLNGDFDEFGGVSEGGFGPEDHDAAQNIKNKIEDSKKLLDMAANIKGLTLDPERKREFMKMLINFDQKYGDQKMMDALEKDIKGNIKGESDLVKTLVTSIKTQLHKNYGEEFNEEIINKVDQSRVSPGSKPEQGVVRSSERKDTDKKDSNKKGENPESITNVKDHMKMQPDKSPLKKPTVIKENPDQHPDRDSKQERTNKSKLSTKLLEMQTSTSPVPSYKTLGERDSVDKTVLKTKQDVRKLNDSTSMIDRDQLKEEFSQNVSYEKSGVIPYNQDEVEAEVVEIEVEEEVEEEVVQDGKVIKIKTIKKTKKPVKVKRDQDGKIMFTYKQTQTLLENLADETDKQPIDRRKPKLSQKASLIKLGSFHDNEDFDDPDFSPKFNVIKRGSALEKTEIRMQEIITETGERKFVPIAITAASKLDVFKGYKRSSTLSPNMTPEPDLKQEGRSSGRYGDMLDSPHLPSSKRKSKEMLGSRGTTGSGNIGQGDDVHMIVGSSLKTSAVNSMTIPGRGEGWNPQALMNALDRFHGDVDDGQRRTKKNEILVRSEYANDTIAADGANVNMSIGQQAAHGRSRKRRPEPIKKIHQTYKSLEPGLQNLETNKGSAYEKGDKPGVWTHVELIELEAGTSRSDYHKDALDPDKMVNNGVNYHKEAHMNPAQFENTFYTPFRQGNMGTKRFMDYMNYLNTLMFMKKLNSLILDFLIKHFATMQQNLLGVEFDPEDPAFRKIFKSRYQKLIKQLRGNLLKKKDFIQSVYSKVFNNPENIPDSVFQSLQNLQKSPQQKPKISHIEQTSSGQDLAIGKPNIDSAPLQESFKLDLRNSKSADLRPGKPENTVKLPHLANKRSEVSKKFSVTNINFKPNLSPRDQAAFGDSRIRSSIGGRENLDDDQSHGKDSKKPRRMNLSSLNQKELEAQKLIRSLNEYDLDHYKHYWNTLGDPLKLDSSAVFSKLDIQAGIQPYHVLLMGHRLGLQIHNADEPDLAWIAYLALVSKLPEAIEKNITITSPQNDVKYQKLCKMKAGEHPGDKYFKTVLLYNQARRKILFEYMTEDEQISYVKSQAWAKLRESTGGVYYFNFMTKQKTINMPTDTKEIISRLNLIASQPEVKEKLRLINEIMVKNDQVFSLIRNKQSRSIKVNNL